MKKTLAILLALVMVLGVFGVAESTWDGAYMEADEFKAYIKNDLDVLLSSIECEIFTMTLEEVVTSTGTSTTLFQFADWRFLFIAEMSVAMLLYT